MGETKATFFLNQQWLWPVLALAAVLWLVFVWKEWKTATWPRGGVNMLLATIAIASLVALILQPQIEVQGSDRSAVLLTDGYQEAHLDSLQKRYPKLGVLSYTEKELHPAVLDTISEVYVLGEGVAAYDLWMLASKKVNFIGGAEVKGITRLAYDLEVVQGDSIKIGAAVAGDYHRGQLYLSDPAGNRKDSIVIDTLIQDYRLGVTAKATGKFLFHLTLRDSLGNEMAKEPIPVQVRPVKSLEILVLNTFPTFETKYLKNKLAAEGHSVLVRSQISKDRYKFENYNRTAETIYGLTKANLAAFDLVILNLDSFTQLNENSRTALLHAVTQEGLGLFVQPDQKLFGSRNSYLPFNFIKTGQDELRLPQWPQQKIATYPFQFKEELLLESQLTIAGKDLAVYYVKGKGRIGTTVIKNTYELLLAGNEAIYDYLWTKIINTTAKGVTRDLRWHQNNELVYPDVPLDFSLAARPEVPVVVDGDSVPIAMRQHPLIAYQWEGIYYPRDTGWQQLAMVQDSSNVFDYYVFDPSQWQDRRRYHRIQNNRRFFLEQTASEVQPFSQAPLSQWWFLGVFLLSMAFLWLSPKW